jgi:hypothetical protein
MLYRFRYNLLALTQAAVGAANVLLLYSVYGLGDSTSVFLIALSIIGSLHLLLSMAYDQFVFHYIKIRVEEPERAETIFVGMLAITSTLGFGCAAAVFVLAEYVIGIFASGFAGERLTLAIDLIKILSLSLLFGSVLQITQARLSGLGKIEWSYILTIIPQLLQACVFLYASLCPTTVHSAALALPVGQALSMLVGLLVVKPTFNRYHHSAKTLQSILVDSSRVRAAHNIHNFFSLYIINTTLSLLPSHFASVFILMKRVADTFLTVITSPLQRVLTNEFGAAMHSGAHVQVRDRLRSLDIRLPVLFGSFLAAGLVVGFALSLGNWVDAEELRYGLICFTVLMVQTTLIATEIPYALVSLALHRSRIFYLSNTIFLMALVSALLFFKEISVSLALPISLSIAQFFNFFIIRHAAQVILKAPRLST